MDEERVSMGANKKAGAAGSPNKNKQSVIVYGTPEWKAWLEEAAIHCRDTVAGLADHAVVDYVKARGFDTPAPRR
jgi:hypothetical protein